MNNLKGTCLITGGTGTYGTACVNYLLENSIFDKIIIFSRDELKQSQLKYSLSKKYPNNNVRFLIGDVRDKERLQRAFTNVDYVIHAAAMKNIEYTEYNPQECIKTNINGTMNVAEASIDCGVKKVLFISSDKASQPSLLYGASKMVAEKFIVQANSYSQNTKFSVCRYGNVVGSRGSILHILLENKDADFVLTHKDMTRFFFSVKEAVKLSLFALENSWGGEVFIPAIKSYKISDLFKLIDPKKPYKIVGMRPDEKLHERLITESEVLRIALNGDCYVIVPEMTFWGNAVKGFYENKMVQVHENMFISETATKLTDLEMALFIREEVEKMRDN